MKTSSFLSINLTDAGKGLLVAVGGAVVAALEGAATGGTLLTLNWKTIGGVALAAGLSYLAKNFFTPEQIITSAK